MGDEEDLVVGQVARSEIVDATVRQLPQVGAVGVHLVEMVELVHVRRPGRGVGIGLGMGEDDFAAVPGDVHMERASERQAVVESSHPHRFAWFVENEHAAAGSGTMACVLGQLVAEAGGRTFDEGQGADMGERVGQRDLAAEAVGLEPELLPLVVVGVGVVRKLVELWAEGLPLGREVLKVGWGDGSAPSLTLPLASLGREYFVTLRLASEGRG